MNLPLDLGSSGSTCFFTDTLFRDANTNGFYDQTEEIPGVSITLLVGGVPRGCLAGTGSNMTWLDPAKGTGNRQFYRLLIRQP